MSIEKKKDHKTGKKHNKNSQYTMRAMQSPVSMRMRTSLIWVERNTFTGVSIVDYQFRLNSLFDPNFTGAGHQPKGFDQLVSFYQRYRVYHTKYKVTFITYGTSTPCVIVCAPTNSVSGYTNVDDAMEATMAKAGYANIYQYAQVRGNVDLAKLNGKTRVAYESDDTTQALVTTNPAEVLQLHVVMGAIDGATNFKADIQIELVFDCEFSDPVELGQS